MQDIQKATRHYDPRFIPAQTMYRVHVDRHASGGEVWGPVFSGFSSYDMARACADRFREAGESARVVSYERAADYVPLD